jgi:hypothetical protein
MNDDDLELVSNQSINKPTKESQWGIFSKVVLFFVTLILSVMLACSILFFSRISETVTNTYTIVKTVSSGIDIIIDMLSKHNGTLIK